MSARDLLPGRREAIELLLLGALGAVALWAFESSYGGYTFFIAGVIFLVLGAGVAHVADRLDFPLALTLGVLVTLYSVVGGVVAMPDRAIGAFVPSLDSVLTSLRMAVAGWKDLVTTAPPVGRTGDLMTLPVLAGVFLGGASVTVLRRFDRGRVGGTDAGQRVDVPALLAIGPGCVVLALGIATGTNRPVSLALHGGLFVALIVAWLGWHEHQRQPILEGHSTAHLRSRLAAALLVLTVAAAAGVGGHERLPLQGDETRDIWRQTVTPPFDPRNYPSPLAGYREYVKAPGGPEGEDPVMFTVEGLPPNVPVRLATMDSFDGLVWQVSGGDADNPSLRDSGSFERIGSRLEPDVDGELVSVTITIHQYSDVWIPDVGEVVEMRFTGSAGGPVRDRELADHFRYNRATDTAASRSPLMRGDRYEMLVRLPHLFETLQGQEITRDLDRLGPSVPGGIVTTALGTADVLAINDDGERLDYVRDLMVEFGTYSDGDRESGQIRARAGHGVARMAEFVGEYPRVPLVGNAEQYASAYALLFRDLGGVPTRVVMGFEPSDSSENSIVEVRATQIEAWVEVPVAGRGWVAIFPTPDRDQTSLQSSSPQQPEPDYRTQNPPPPPLIDPEFDAPATAAGDAAPPPTPVPEDEETSSDDGGGVLPSPPDWTREALLASSPLIAALLAAAAIVVLKRRRSRHRRRAGLPHEQVIGGWREVTDFAVDTGRPVPADMTRAEAARFVGGRTPGLACRADEIVWGGGEPDHAAVDEYWDDIQAALAEMRRSLPVKDRLKAAVSLESFKADRARQREKVEA